MRNVAFALALLISVAVGSRAQVITGTLLGSVTDPSGNPIAGAAVAARNVDTNVRTTAPSGASGEFTIPLLQTGNYEIQISAEGFKTFKQTAIRLELDSKFRVEARLEIGDVKQSIEVVSKLQVLQTDSTDLNTDVSKNLIESLPNAARNPMMYVLNAPGVVGREGFDDPLLFAVGDESRSRMTNFSVNGARPISSEVTLDGAPNTSTAFNEVAVVPNLDSIGEIKITTNAYSAEFGRSAGGVISFGTKSGQNAFHGSLYEYFQNSALNATGWTNNSYGRKADGAMVRPKAVFNTHKFGGTYSGPVVFPHYDGRNKTFFFISYEGNRRATGNSQLYTVPTEQERNGDFSNSWSVVNGKVVSRQIYVPLASTTTIPSSPTDAAKYRLDRQQACDPSPCTTASTQNKIPAKYLNPTALRLVSLYPLPNLPGDQNGASNYFNPNSDRVSTNQFSLKLDRVVTQSQRMFGRYIQDATNSAPANLFRDTDPNVANVQPTKQWNPSGTIGYTWALSATSIADARINVTRVNVSLLPSSGLDYDFTKLGFTPEMISYSPSGIFPVFTVGGGFPAFGLTGYQARDNHSTNGSANGSYTKVLKSWTVKLGGEYRTYLSNFNQQFPASMGFAATATRFSQQCTAYGYGCAAQPSVNGSALADFLMGAIDGGIGAGTGQFTQSSPRLALKNSYWGFYSENDWRATRKLTVNLGVRYEVAPPVTERYNRMSQFNPGGTNYTGTQGVMMFAGVAGNGRNQQDTDWHNFAPRLGLAYRLDGKTVVRSAYGLFYDITTGFGSGAQRFGVNGFDAPAFINIRPNSGLASGSDILVSAFNQSAVTGGRIIGANPLDPRYLARDIDAIVGRKQLTPYLQQWNFTIQRELPKGFMVQAAYAGSKGTRLILGSRPLNAFNTIPQGVLADARTKYIATGANPMSDMVPNPFYGILTSGSAKFLGPTIQRSQLSLAYPAFQNITQFQERAGSSSYNSLQVTLRRAFRHGFEFSGFYTFSKNIDMGNHISVTNYNTSNGAATGPVDFGLFDRSLNRSVANSDTPHVFNATYTVELPFGKGRAWLKSVPVLTQGLSGWKVAGMTTLRTGFPLAISSGATYGRPDMVADAILPKEYQVVGDGKTAYPLPDGTTLIVPNGNKLIFNPHAFKNRMIQVKTPSPTTANPHATMWVDDVYYYGNAPRYNSGLRGFGLYNTDLSLMRIFKLGEGKNVTFKADAMNVFNRTHFSDGSLGKVEGTSLTNQNFASGGVWANPDSLTEQQRATLGTSSNLAFGTRDKNAGLVRGPRYMSLSLHIRF